MATLKKVAIKKRAAKITEPKSINRGNGKKAAAVHNNTIAFHYQKGEDFRSIHVDGAIGGVTSKGFIHMAVFAERAPLPRTTTFKISQKGTLGDEVMELRDSKEGIIRQMEIDLFMNEATARDLRTWLDDRLRELEERQKIVAAQKIKVGK